MRKSKNKHQIKIASLAIFCYDYIMKKRFYAILIIISFLAVIVPGTVAFYFFQTSAKQSASANNFKLTSFPKVTPIIKKIEYVSGVVPHHLVAEKIIRKFFLEISQNVKPETIIILSPDHFKVANFSAQKGLISLAPETAEFNELAVDKELLAFLYYKKLIGANNSALALEHGITNLLPYIKQYLPETKILSLVIPQDYSINDLQKIIDDLFLSGEKFFILASTDFSHYLLEEAASFHDVKSARVLVNFEEEEFSNLEVDCPLCLVGTRYLAKLQQAENYKFIGQANSADLVKTIDEEGTTSYLSLLFSQDIIANQPKFIGQTVLFAGDIMLDRGVEELMMKNSIYYPFEKISNLLRGTDLVVGNLEGPIVKTPKDFGPHSLEFNFSQEVLAALKYAKFNLFSLANNHILNRNQQGLIETKELLSQNNFYFMGDPIDCSAKDIYKIDNLIFIALNKTFPANCSDQQIADLVGNVRQENPNHLLVVNLHWGTEYQTVNSAAQKQLAHLIIDQGADLIIGHHPHVVQNVEEYNGKLIFYSLGNFIFDQYFKKEVQQGLAVGWEIYPQKYIFNLFPLQSKLSQPDLMSAQEKAEFLAELSKNSSPSLEAQIKSGKIEVNR